MPKGAERWRRTGRVYTPSPNQNVPVGKLSYEDQPNPLPAKIDRGGSGASSISTMTVSAIVETTSGSEIVSMVSSTEKGASMGSSFTTTGLIKFLSQMITAVNTTAHSLEEIVSSNRFRHLHKINVSFFVVPGMVKPLALLVGTQLKATGDQTLPACHLQHFAC